MKNRVASPAPHAAPPGELVPIGVLTRPHGLKGELCLDYYADSTEWLEGSIWLRGNEHTLPRPGKVAGMRRHQGQLLVRIEGFADRTAAEHLRGTTLLIPESALPESDADNLYLHDLIGLAVHLAATDERIGVLAHVDFVGEQELWIIEGPSGNEILFPAVPEFVTEVALEQGIIRITPPSGLLELYTADAAR